MAVDCARPEMKFALIVLVLLGMLFDRGSAASVPVIGLDPETDLSTNTGTPHFGFTDQNVEGTVGWTFRVLQPIRVTMLGWYDDGRDGLSHAHAVGISQALSPTPFNGTGNMYTTIPAGDAARLIGSWRVELINAVTLSPGYYSIVGYDYTDSPDPIKFAASSYPLFLPTDPRIDEDSLTPIFGDYTGATYSIATGGAFFGPMLFVQPVPEPSATSLGLLGVAFLVATHARSVIQRWTVVLKRFVKSGVE
jgi:hypothetical protein